MSIENFLNQKKLKMWGEENEKVWDDLSVVILYPINSIARCGHGHNIQQRCAEWVNVIGLEC